MDTGMRKYTENGITILEPAEGLWLTNGETYSEKVYLGRNANENDWSEVLWDGTYPEDDGDEEVTAEEITQAIAEVFNDEE